LVSKKRNFYTTSQKSIYSVILIFKDPMEWSNVQLLEHEQFEPLWILLQKWTSALLCSRDPRSSKLWAHMFIWPIWEPGNKWCQTCYQLQLDGTSKALELLEILYWNDPV